MDITIPEFENEEKTETEWINNKDVVKNVGDTWEFTFDKLHQSDKAILLFDNEDNKGTSFFTVSDYAGQTMGERFFIACALKLKLKGNVNTDVIVEAINNSDKRYTLEISLLEPKSKKHSPYRKLKVK